MFSGLIEEIGEVKTLRSKGDVYLLEIKTPHLSGSLKIGDSIAINGVCLTVTKKAENLFSVEVMDKTYQDTNLRYLRRGVKVNLELAMKIGDRFGGHILTGHIDTVSRVIGNRRSGKDRILEVGMPGDNRDLIIPKGSVAIDGVSLTVGKTRGRSFIVYLIPHTLKNTTLGGKRPGDKVNIEIDIIGKYLKGISHK